MTENKRFWLITRNDEVYLEEMMQTGYVRDNDLIGEKSITLEEAVNTMNALHEENQQLKAQLYCDNNEGICNICQHQYLVGNNTGYYIAKCKKGHEKCSKETVKHCEDFEIVEVD